MRLDINDNYCITSDEYQFVVSKKGVSGKDTKEPGKETLRPVAYFNTFDGCLSYVVNKQIRESDCKTFSDVRSELDRIYREIHQAVNM